MQQALIQKLALWVLGRLPSHLALKVVLLVLEKLAERTDTKFDDEAIATIKKLLM